MHQQNPAARPRALASPDISAARRLRTKATIQFKAQLRLCNGSMLAAANAAGVFPGDLETALHTDHFDIRGRVSEQP